MDENYQIDNLDRQILNFLLKDARTPYLEIARKLIVSGGTIHQRVDRLKKIGVLTGSSAKINLSKIDLTVTVLIGLHLESSLYVKSVIDALRVLPEIVEAHYTTGNYALILKLHTGSIKNYHDFLVNKLQSIEGIRATDSFICLDTPIFRNVNLGVNSIM